MLTLHPNIVYKLHRRWCKWIYSYFANRPRLPAERMLHVNCTLNWTIAWHISECWSFSQLMHSAAMKQGEFKYYNLLLHIQSPGAWYQELALAEKKVHKMCKNCFMLMLNQIICTSISYKTSPVLCNYKPNSGTNCKLLTYLCTYQWIRLAKYDLKL